MKLFIKNKNIIYNLVTFDDISNKKLIFKF